MKEELTATLEFIDPRFDLSSDLPAESNQCYGKDVADALSAAYTAEGYNPNVFEEDWGWCVVVPTAERAEIELGIYPWGFLGDETGKNEYLWRLRVTFRERVKILGLLPMLKQSAVSSHVGDEVTRLISGIVDQFVRLDYGEIWR